MGTRIKVCCVQDATELDLALRHGADHVGLVAAMPSGPGPIPDARIRALAAAAPADASAVLLTSRTEPEAVVAHVVETGPDMVQLVAPVGPAVYEALRGACPEVGIVQVVHVIDGRAVAEAVWRADHVDALLLDSGQPGAAVPELGGTGRVHDWSVSREIVAAVDVPVFLAGGLNPSNVGGALEAVRPHGVDVCSGVRVDGALDPAALGGFIGEVRRFDEAAAARSGRPTGAET